MLPYPIKVLAIVQITAKPRQSDCCFNYFNKLPLCASFRDKSNRTIAQKLVQLILAIIKRRHLLWKVLTARNAYVRTNTESLLYYQLSRKIRAGQKFLGGKLRGLGGSFPPPKRCLDKTLGHTNTFNRWIFVVIWISRLFHTFLSDHQTPCPLSTLLCRLIVIICNFYVLNHENVSTVSTALFCSVVNLWPLSLFCPHWFTYHTFC